MNLKINWKKITKAIIVCSVSLMLACYLTTVLSVAEYRVVVCILSLCAIVYYTCFRLISGGWHKVENFEYNGFSGQNLPGFTTYKAKFGSWTSDPGVANWLCSDGEYRSIPTFAIHKLKYKKLPKQTYPKGKIMFGASSKS